MIILEEGEKVERICRRHWFVFVSAALEVGVAWLAVLGGGITAYVFFPEFFSQYIELIALGIVLMLQLLWIIFFLVISDNYLDVWIVTDKRLILTEIKGLFSRTVSSVSLKDIQDVSTEVHGIIQTFLGYGDVRAQSSGTEGSFIFKNIAHPYEVQQFILEKRTKALQS